MPPGLQNLLEKLIAQLVKCTAKLHFNLTRNIRIGLHQKTGTPCFAEHCNVWNSSIPQFVNGPTILRNVQNVPPVEQVVFQNIDICEQ